MPCAAADERLEVRVANATLALALVFTDTPLLRALFSVPVSTHVLVCIVFLDSALLWDGPSALLTVDPPPTHTRTHT